MAPKQKVNVISTLNEDYNLTDSLLNEGKILMESDDKYDNVSYEEYPYNIYLENYKGFTLLDRKTEHQEFKKIEFLTLK